MARCDYQGMPEEYVLGMLGPAERADFEAHLARCPACRAVVATMAPLPGLMRHVHSNDPSGAGEVGDRVTDQEGSATERRYHPSRGRGRIVVLIAAALTAAAGVGAGVVATEGNQRVPAGGPSELVTGSEAATGVSATATLTAEPTGTLLQMRLHGLPPGVTCRLVVTTRNDPPQTAAAWRSAYSSDITVQGTSSAAPYDITGIAVVTTHGQVLLSMRGP
jgi:anti-sigma factor RsiW